MKQYPNKFQKIHQNRNFIQRIFITTEMIFFFFYKIIGNIIFIIISFPFVVTQSGDFYYCCFCNIKNADV
jgi:hypothetical protein